MAFDYECDKMFPNLILSFLLLKVIETGLGERAGNVQFFSQICTYLLFQKQGFGTKFWAGIVSKTFRKHARNIHCPRYTTYPRLGATQILLLLA